MAGAFDVLVIGTGGVGSAALWELARRGLRVLGLDRFAPAHDRGSSHGATRLIRLAYFEHPDYVPLLRRAYDRWEGLERETGQELYREVGLIEAGPLDGAVVPGVLASARLHGLEVEEMDADAARRRWPGFRFRGGERVVFEKRAGILHVERCVRAQLEAAARSGAEHRPCEPVTGWRRDGRCFAVQTDKGVYQAGKLVVAGGAWSANLLADLGLPLLVQRKPVWWFESKRPEYHAERGCPAFLFEGTGGMFYGFPAIDELGVKVAEHTGGEVVRDPESVDRGERPGESRLVEAFLRERLPGVSRRKTGFSVCMYTMTPDGHFILDRHPGEPNVVFAAGLSGHGFKFAPAIGEALADLALDRPSKASIEFLSLARPGLGRR